MTYKLCLTLFIWDFAIFLSSSLFQPIALTISFEFLYLIPSLVFLYYAEENFIHSPRREVERKLQKLRKLEFNTRLGMHSPV